MSLTNSEIDGRVISGFDGSFFFNDQFKTKTESRNVETTHECYYKYLLLNPAGSFKEIVDEARAVVLAGGTMEPVSAIFICICFCYHHLNLCSIEILLTNYTLMCLKLVKPFSPAVM